MNSLIVLNAFEFFHHVENLKKNFITNSMTRKILKCNVEFSYKNISEQFGNKQ